MTETIIKFRATAKRVRARMLPVKTALPSLWQWVEDAIEENAAKGILIVEE